MGFVLKRIAQMVAVIIAATFLAFTAMNTLGDPLFNVVGFHAAVDCDAVLAGEIEDISGQGGTDVGDCEVVEAAREKYHLNDPLPVRYVRWLGDVVQGDLGVSFKNSMPVSTIIGSRIPKSIFLMVVAEIFALVIAVPAAIRAAYKANGVFDKSSTVSSFGFISLPNFALGVILFYLFVVKWQIFPSRYEGDDLFSRLRSTVLPGMTLALPLAATYFRLLRTDLITTLQEDFVLMAKAKGLSDRWIMFRHVLRPSLFSLVTVFGLSTGGLIGGALVVEQIFVIPGLGRTFVEAVIRDDFPLVLGLVTIISSSFIAINFIVDIFYSVIDPRVSRET